MLKDIQQYEGQIYGYLTIIRTLRKPYRGRPSVLFAEVRCQCGKVYTIFLRDVIGGRSKSCGCMRGEMISKRMTRHGGSKSRLFNIWQGMRYRCMNPNSKAYADYGLRGIQICALWEQDFQIFREWATSHGYTETLTIERINVNKGYDPDNCTWISKGQQSKNTRNTVRYTIGEETMILSEWAERYSISYATIQRRIAGGWSVEQAITTAPYKKRVQKNE